MPVIFEPIEGAPESVEVDLLIIPVAAGGLDEASSPPLAAVDEVANLDIPRLAAEEDFDGEVGKTLLVRGLSGLGTRRVLLVGLGAGERSNEELFRAGRQAAGAAREARARRVGLASGQLLSAHQIATFACGFGHGAYRFDKYISGDERGFEGTETLAVLGADEAVTSALEAAQALCRGVEQARDLVNEPAHELTPAELARRAENVAASGGLEHTVFDGSSIVEHGFNLIHAVGRGSASPPRLIHLVYRPDGEVRHRLAFVGKGITFDTGGYSMKSPEHMKHMHADMAGGAAVIGAASVIGELRPPGVEIHFIVPAAENAVSGEATRPQDIVRGYGGKSVEIDNTDAEGRLVLADALAYAQEKGVDTIVDLATLTGSSVVALGEYTAALFANDQPLADALLEAARDAGEALWQMPLDPKLDHQLDSPVADMKNVGKRWGGAITAALFLRRWVHIDRWAHLDIAGPAYADSGDRYRAQGGSGYGVATLVALVSRLAEADAPDDATDEADAEA